jgi:hypothetical protein
MRDGRTSVLTNRSRRRWFFGGGEHAAGAIGRDIISGAIGGGCRRDGSRWRNSYGRCGGGRLLTF